VTETGLRMDGIEFMGENVKKRLKSCGVGVVIHPLAKIIYPESVEIGDYSMIDDYTFIEGGQGVRIGRFVHIASFCSIVGNGILDMDDFSALAAGCRIITGSDDFSGRSLTNPCIPARYKPFLHRGRVTIGKHTVLGTNTIVYPDVAIGPYSATGAGTVVTRDLGSAGIYMVHRLDAWRIAPRENLSDWNVSCCRSFMASKDTCCVRQRSAEDRCLA